MRTYHVDKNKIDVRDIFILSNLFVVPYKTMVKRLYEIKLLSRKRYNELMELSNEKVEIWRKRLGLSLPNRSNEIGLSNLLDMAMELYEAKKITREKLEYLLGLAELGLAEMGITEAEAYIPPTDEELEVIREE